MNKEWENAVRRGDIDLIRELLDRGQDINARDRHNQTALMLSAHAGHREVVELLIDYRANLNVTAKFGLSALMLAVIAGHTEIARLLARAGADLSLRGTGAPGFVQKTARDVAVARGMPELAGDLEAEKQ